MKKLLRYKRIDLCTQLAAFILPWLFFIIVPGFGRAFQLEHLLASYCIVGVVQVASWLINRFRLADEYKISGRRWYEKCLMVLIILVPAGAMLKVLLFVFVVLLYASPALAIGYLAITIIELRRLSRPIPNVDTGIIETHLQ